MIDNVNILYDHYKDTCNIVRNKEKARNKIFIICASLVAILLIITIESDTKNLIVEYIQYLLKSKTPINIPTIESLILIVFVYTTLVYYNACFFIEREYKYIHKLEIDLQRQLKYDISREVSLFTTKFSIVSNIIYYLYTHLFPLIGAALILYKSTVDILTGNVNAILNLIIGIVGLIIVVAYMIKEDEKISLNTVKNPDFF